MILAVDIGNTSVNLGLFTGEKLTCRMKLASDPMKTADEYAAVISAIFAMKKIDVSEITGAILLSVVPGLTHSLTLALGEAGIHPMVVGAGIRTGLNIRVENPSALGSDIVADTVGAMHIAEPPFAVVDFGTATTITAVDPEGVLRGCIIAPGVKLSHDALSKSCAMLPDVPLSAPEKLLGANTADSMNSGSVYGSALMLDGFINRLRAEYGERLTVIATGGLSELIVPFCASRIIREPDLTLCGLLRLYELNTRPKKNQKGARSLSEE